jgi:hypothetical protein
MATPSIGDTYVTVSHLRASATELAGFGMHVRRLAHSAFIPYIEFDCCCHLCYFYCYACMSEMTFRALLFCTNFMNTPPKEGMKPLVRILFLC